MGLLQQCVRGSYAVGDDDISTGIVEGQLLHVSDAKVYVAQLQLAGS